LARAGGAFCFGSHLLHWGRGPDACAGRCARCHRLSDRIARDKALALAASASPPFTAPQAAECVCAHRVAAVRRGAVSRGCQRLRL